MAEGFGGTLPFWKCLRGAAKPLADDSKRLRVPIFLQATSPDVITPGKALVFERPGAIDGGEDG